MYQSIKILAFLGLPAIVQAANSTLIDPNTRFPDFNYTLPSRQNPANFPSLQLDFASPPDCGEDSYHGTGRLRGRKALITGGDSGIGRAVAIAFAKEGADVAISYLPDEEPDAQDLANYFENRLGKTLHRIPGDLLVEDFSVELVEQANDALNGLDILVSNAGWSGLQWPEGVHITNQTTEEFDRIFRTNVYAGFWLSRAAVPYLPPGSNIIFTASLAANNPARRSTAYSASKAAILSFSQGLSGQLGTAGIRVNAVLPSLTYTPFLHTIGLTNVELDVLAPTSPIGRLEQPVEVAVQYVNFADPQNSYASGGFVGTPGSNY